MIPSQSYSNLGFGIQTITQYSARRTLNLPLPIYPLLPIVTCLSNYSSILCSLSPSPSDILPNKYTHLHKEGGGEGCKSPSLHSGRKFAVLGQNKMLFFGESRLKIWDQICLKFRPKVLSPPTEGGLVHLFMNLMTGTASTESRNGNGCLSMQKQ